MTDSEKVIARVRNLLRLATSSNEHEAAAAAGAAQKLIERHALDAAMLDADGGKPASDDEPVREHDDPLDAGKSKVAWKGVMAGGIARANACRVYWRGGSLMLVGAASNAASARYLYAYLTRELERLSRQYAGNGRSWLHAWRVGCAQTIAERVKEAREQARRDALGEATPGTALARVSNGIARLNAQDAAVDAYIGCMGLRSGRRTRVSSSGYQAGRRDGAHVNIANSGPALGAGARARVSP